MKYMSILADPPWQQPMAGKYQGRHTRPRSLTYPTMTIQEICSMPIGEHAAEGCHLWLWTTNAFLEAGFEVMRRWGFTYLAPIHWIKPSGFGNYVIHRTQTLLLGYFRRCSFQALRYFDNIVEANPLHHSQKPDAFHSLIEQVSAEPRLELFAREKRFGWDVWGNEVYPDVDVAVKHE